MNRRQKERRQSAARRRAEEHSSGFSTSTLEMPDGLSFSNSNQGYTSYQSLSTPLEKVILSQKRAPPTSNGPIGSTAMWVQAKRISWLPERHSVRMISLKKKLHGCLKIRMLLRMKSKLSDRKRQLFLVYDHDEPDSGLQLLEVSNFCFGKLLDERIQNSEEEEGWDLFYCPDEDGMILRITVVKETGGGYEYSKTSAIDFLPRKEPLPDAIINHGICLDNLLIEPSYDELKNAYLGLDGSDETPDDDDEPPARSRKSRPKKEETAEDPPEEKPKKTQTRKPKEAEKPKDPIASDYGLEVGDVVQYKEDGEIYTVEIIRISKDGTSLTCENVDDDDQIFKGVGPEEVKKGKPKKTTSKKADPEPDPDPDDEPDGSDGDNEWDEDWD